MVDYDMLVVGGGPVGATLTLALRGTGLAVGLLEARAPHAAADRRPIALSYGSRLILERLGLWERLAPATPILRIHVSQRGGFGRVELNAREAVYRRWATCSTTVSLPWRSLAHSKPGAARSRYEPR